MAQHSNNYCLCLIDTKSNSSFWISLFRKKSKPKSKLNDRLRDAALERRLSGAEGSTSTEWRCRKNTVYDKLRQQSVTVITCSGSLALTIQQSMKTSSNRVATLKRAPIIATNASGSISTSDPLSAVDFITHAACQPLQCRHRLPRWWAGGLSEQLGWMAPTPHWPEQ